MEESTRVTEERKKRKGSSHVCVSRSWFVSVLVKGLLQGGPQVTGGCGL